MSQLHKSAASQEARPERPAPYESNRGAELAAQADLRLAGYPADIREQVSDLLRVLAGRPGETKVR